ncbi:MAG: PAS domain-containing protein [Gemmatimonadetes bacterium]|nr:PAS domain-containing protein [Gemmatimonadota bacterium]NIQ57126.1 PAS domain-containing protein [Gemmatimonadota bacterium]NIU77297.1 PAS domain-containing protein [Gammaproteobacteria bacterium]NIX46567.1 PAS domain-containing protein [Gemmatimonadota bacterium]NIY10885.1 PAS domain-containing protein [Gemmatimonadota bacterium]
MSDLKHPAQAASALEHPEPLDGTLGAEILDTLGEAVVATDRDGRIIYWNAAARHLFGWAAHEMVGASALDALVPGGAPPETRSIIEQLIRGRRWSGDVVLQDRHGVPLPVRATLSAHYGADGERSGVTAVLREAPSDAEAEAALQDSQDRLALTRRAAAAVIWELGPRTGMVRWSDGIEDVFGYTPDQVEPTVEWWLERTHPEDRPRMEAAVEEFLGASRRFWTEEYRFRRSDGTYATVFDRAFASHDRDGRVVRIVGAMTDLTDRRRLREQQRLLAQVSMILDLSLDYEATLPTVAGLIANSMVDYCLLHLVPGAGVTFATGAHADASRQPLVDRLSAFLAEGLPDDSAVAKVVRDGESVLLHRLPDAPAAGGDESGYEELMRALGPRTAMIVPLRARSRVLGAATFARTSPEPAYDEDDLRLAEELGRRIGLAVDHALLQESAELANRAKSDFLSIISHELRTPLTAVLGYADLLASEVSGSLTGTQKKQVERVRAASDRLLRLIESILAYARLETGRERVHLEPVAPRDLVDRAADIIAPRALEKDIAFHMDIGPLPDRVSTDPGKFLQVLLSLLSNAVKFTDRGAVMLRGGTDGDTVYFEIVDSGEGIPVEHRPYVFNAFWQAEQPATRRASGAGLGLSVARRLARLLGGDVVLGDTSRGGSTFRFTVPIVPGD